MSIDVYLYHSENGFHRWAKIEFVIEYSEFYGNYFKNIGWLLKIVLMNFTIRGWLIDYWEKRIHVVEITVRNGIILSIREIPDNEKIETGYIMPGFIDSHIHIESSMLIPSEFARLAVIHGTVATVSDPHEIANVCGMEGVKYMIDNGKRVPLKFHFGAPSCVPATTFETAGAALDSKMVEDLLHHDDIYYLSEMMNFPGVLFGDPEVMKKIEASHKIGKPVDGHAPGLRGEQAKKYISAGISTDHECFTKEEALDKLMLGMKIIIREGSAAKNFEALIDLLNDYPDMMMFCSDDKHPDSLVVSHINSLCARAIAKGIDLFKIVRAACINPVEHYKLRSGMLRVGDPADFIVVDDLEKFKVRKTFIDGELVAENGQTNIKSIASGIINNFSCNEIESSALEIVASEQTRRMPVIEALDGQLITNKLDIKLKEADGKIISDVDNDILKIVVVNRYNDAPIAKSFIRNFGLKNGALASSVAHDSHNIVAVGTDDRSIMKAVNLIIRAKGGVSCITGNDEIVVDLPVAGLMSNGDGFEVAEAYTKIDALAKKAGSKLSAPFMTLSFMALLVIPHLKLSDKGLFDGDSFKLIISP
jgi:adenine deaminase